jgi:hypothetical protein
MTFVTSGFIQWYARTVNIDEVSGVVLTHRVALCSKTVRTNIHSSCMRENFIRPEVRPVTQTVCGRVRVVPWVARWFIGREHVTRRMARIACWAVRKGK